MKLQFAQKAVITANGCFLLVRKSMSDPHQPGRWELPGGRLKDNESLDDAIVREVHEEVGLHVTPGRPLAIWSWRLGEGSDAPMVIAVARLCTVSSGTVNMENHDVDDYIEKWGWFSAEDIKQLDLIPSARQPIEEALTYVAGA